MKHKDSLKWATTWQNQQNECAPSEDSDQPGHTPSLISLQWVAKDPSFLHADREDWSDWADAQADKGRRWAQSHFVGFVMLRLKYAFELKKKYPDLPTHFLPDMLQ